MENSNETNSRKRTRVVSIGSIDDEEVMDDGSKKPSLFLPAKKQCFLDGFLHRAMFDIVDEHLNDMIFGIGGGHSQEKTTSHPLEEKDTCHMNKVLQSFLLSPVSLDIDQFCTMIETMEKEKEGGVHLQITKQ